MNSNYDEFYKVFLPNEKSRLNYLSGGNILNIIKHFLDHDMLKSQSK